MRLNLYKTLSINSLVHIDLVGDIFRAAHNPLIQSSAVFIMMQKIVDTLLDYYVDTCSKRELFAMFNNGCYFWRLTPKPEPGEDAQEWCWRYLQRHVLYRKLCILSLFSPTDANPNLATLLQKNWKQVAAFLCNDELTWSVFTPAPGTHVGLLMSQIICGPLTQAYLDQAHGGDSDTPEHSFVDSNYKILNAAFMGSNFKPHLWDYYRVPQNVLECLDINSDKSQILWGIQSVLIEHRWQWLSTLPNGDIVEKESGDVISESRHKMVLDVARNDLETLRKYFTSICRDVLGVSPLYKEDPIAVKYFQCFDKKMLKPLTINTILRQISTRETDAITLYRFFYEQIKTFLNSAGNTWFDTFLHLFVNMVCSSAKGDITPLDRRNLGSKRDIISAAAFECPLDFIQTPLAEKKEIWPLAASIIGISSTLHGPSYYAFEIQDHNNSKE